MTEYPVQFQFLIGRLGTQELQLKQQPIKGFQFLIGRLGTVLQAMKDSFYRQFQFLIGRLGTVMGSWKIVIMDCFNSS